jgi:hypothetical protein
METQNATPRHKSLNLGTKIFWIMSENKITLPDEVIMNKIYLIRGEKVMLDRDLAELYGVETKYLKRQVKRNADRFPEDFMFQLIDKEFKEWRRQFVTSKSSDYMGLRYAPYAFTEQGVAQLSSVLNSKRAIAVNIQIIRLFTKMRKMLITHKDLLLKINEMESRITDHDQNIRQIFEYLKRLIKEQGTPRKQIGFKTKKK